MDITSKLPRIIGLKGGQPVKAVPLFSLSDRNKSELPRAKATIAIYSVKGGVGKTTLATNLAWYSACQSYRRTLLWDLDAAGGAGFLYDVDVGESSQIKGVFAREQDPRTFIQRTAYNSLDILPADESIRTLDSQFLQIGKRKRLQKLTDDLLKTYDRIILDCPPVMNELSKQIVRAADVVIIPLPPSPLSTRAFDLVVKEIKDNTKHPPPILPVLSMLDMRRGLHKQLQSANPNWPSIPYASVVEQCAVQKQPVGTFAPQSQAGKAFQHLWAVIETRLGG